jgi:hypothetical protein
MRTFPRSQDHPLQQKGNNMKLRIATITLALLGIGSTLTMKLPASEVENQAPKSFGGGGAPTPCLPPSVTCPNGPVAPTSLP